MKPDENCEDCGGTGIVYEDEYENGQCVGIATIDIPCICTIPMEQEEYDQE